MNTNEAIAVSKASNRCEVCRYKAISGQKLCDFCKLMEHQLNLEIAAQDNTLAKE